MGVSTEEMRVCAFPGQIYDVQQKFERKELQVLIRASDGKWMNVRIPISDAR